MSVKRYDYGYQDGYSADGMTGLQFADDGALVKYEDYAALEARCAALAAELSAVLTDRAVILEDLDNTCFEIGMQRGEKVDAYPTPTVANHDAFLAEVRAQGVDECVRQLVISDDDDFSDAPNICAMVAHQLRKGVQS